MEDDEDYDLRQMVEELCDIDEGLTPWEVNFIDDMSRWEGRYTENQADVIRRIHLARIK